MKALLFAGLFLLLPQSEIQVSNFQQYDLTPKDLVEIITDFDIKHVGQQPFFPPAYGVTDFTAYPPTMWLFNTSDRRDRLSTAIHECLHVHYRNVGLNPPEEFINAEETRLYQKYFVEGH